MKILLAAAICLLGFAFFSNGWWILSILCGGIAVIVLLKG
jgi:hypothetical protein